MICIYKFNHLLKIIQHYEMIGGLHVVNLRGPDRAEHEKELNKDATER